MMKIRGACSVVVFMLSLFVLSGYSNHNYASDEVKIAQPDQLTVPVALTNGSGKYFLPYTADGVVTDWIDKGIELEMGANVGTLIGVGLANEVLSEIPVFGALIGKSIGDRIGKEAAISAIGGMEFIRKTSDYSFQEIDKFAVFLYAKHATHRDYKRVFEVTVMVYPELKTAYYSAIVEASKEAFSFDVDLGD